VAQPHEDDRAVGPEVSEADLLAVLVGQRDVGQIAQARDSTAAAALAAPPRGRP